jgi:4-carboxymuconolactone decarboxylase
VKAQIKSPPVWAPDSSPSRERDTEREKMTSNDRYQRGLAKLAEIDGQQGQKVLDSLADIAPDFARYLIEFPFGDIYSRPGLGNL